VSRRGALQLAAGVAVVAGGVALTACGSPYPGRTLGQQVRSWASSTNLSGSLASLRGDARRVLAVEAGHDPAAVRTDCDVLVNDALAANQNLPTPDDMLSGILTTAYGTAAAAGRECIRAAGDAAVLARAASDLSRAAEGYVKAQARLDVLGATGTGGSS
jgi:hypothetical protein